MWLQLATQWNPEHPQEPAGPGQGARATAWAAGCLHWCPGPEASVKHWLTAFQHLCLASSEKLKLKQKWKGSFWKSITLFYITPNTAFEFFVRIKARFNSINMVYANQSVHLYYFGLFYSRLLDKRQLCLSYDIKGRLWSQRSPTSLDKHWLAIRREIWDLSCPFTLHVEHVLALFYRELITRPGKFIPEYEADVRRWCQSVSKEYFHYTYHRVSLGWKKS